MNLSGLQKDILLRTHLNIKAGAPRGDLVAVTHTDRPGSITNAKRAMINEFIIHDIKDLFGLDLAQFMVLDLIEYELIMDIARGIIREKNKVKGGKDVSQQ